MRMSALEKQFVNQPGHAASAARRMVRLLEHYVEFRAGWRYLDAGCGMGAAARTIALLHPLDVVGIDVDPEQIELARAGEAVENLWFETADLTRLPFASGSFEVVAVNMVTHHIPCWEVAFREMVRVLRPGGYLLFRDFAVPHWIAAAARSLLPQAAGYPSEQALNALASQGMLDLVHRSRGAVHIQMVWKRLAN